MRIVDDPSKPMDAFEKRMESSESRTGALEKRRESVAGRLALVLATMSGLMALTKGKA